MYKLNNAITQSTLKQDKDGFLHGMARVLKVGVMEYRRSELGFVPDYIKGDRIRLNVSRETLENAASQKTLEGKPIIVGHKWQGIDQNSSVGCVSGAPIVDLPYLMCGFMLNDKKTRDKVQSKDESVAEISSGYYSEIAWNSQIEGVHGEQIKLHFNHLSMEPKGEGRGGEDVRILNKKELSVEDYTEVKINNRTIRVHNQDAEEAEKINSDATIDVIKENDLKMNELEKQINDLRTENGALRDKLEASEKEKDRSQGELDSTKETLQNALSQENIFNKAKELVLDQEVATKVLNSNNLDMDEKLKNLSGSPLKRAVLNKIQNAKSLPEISQDKNDDYVDGRFSSSVEHSTEVKIAPAGSAELIKNSKAKAFSGFMTGDETPEEKQEKLLNSLKRSN